ncbi:MAG: exodeoxyribonuclease VII large subunit [Lachnospiraceae bacterium]|nr:exodeoxyribonuclease VII large subunit [Lachnospiraceae bacterium]
MRSIYSVAQVNAYIKNMFYQDYMLRSLWVKGEVSNCKIHSSGHIYFTLKDEKGVLSCVMFAGNRAGLSFLLQNGQQVFVFGSIEVYERDGKYQLYAKQIQKSGIGHLYEQFERLKQELSELGMFSNIYKKPIPTHAQVLGVVTAQTGAAIRDIIQIAKRRNPYLQIVLYPAIVQGAHAAPSIVKGIQCLDTLGVDVIIVGRGGGSLEDLWAFNEREVAQAAFDCSVPIISAVGHETDVTILDFVADLRAPTPSAAAELAVADMALFDRQMSELAVRFLAAMNAQIKRKKDQLKISELRLLRHSPQSRIREMKMDILRMEERFSYQIKQLLLHKRHELSMLRERFKGLSPMHKLESGYAYVEDSYGKHIRSIREVQDGQNLHVLLQDGTMQVTVTQTKQNQTEGSYGKTKTDNVRSHSNGESNE